MSSDDGGEFIVLERSRRDPDGTRFRGALDAHFSLERARAQRDLAVYCLAAAGFPLWLATARPGWLPPNLRVVAAGVWLVCLAAVVIAINTEWRFHRRRALVLAHAPVSPALAVAAGPFEEHPSTVLGNVSHDLRTPLAAITGAATTLREVRADPLGPQDRELLDTICEEAERLERQVRNLLDLWGLGSGALEVKRDRNDPEVT